MVVVGNEQSTNNMFENRLLANPATLHRVKRKGIGSFFGAKAKTTPNTWDSNNGNNRFPIYGAGGELHGPGSIYFQHGENYREANLYYLIVASISFGIIVYCCYQCQSETRRSLDDRIGYRNPALQLQNQPMMSATDDDSSNRFGVIDAYSNRKPIAPSAPDQQQLVQSTNASFEATVPSYPTYPDNPPPSYQEAIQSECRTQNQPVVQTKPNWSWLIMITELKFNLILTVQTESNTILE